MRIVVFKGSEEYASDKELANVPLFKDYPEGVLDIAIIFCCIFMILGIPGNLLTIAALARYRKVRNATAIFIINLSVADLLCAVFVIPIAVDTFVHKSWKAGIFMCRLYPNLNYSFVAASMFSIVAITVNRYVMVAHPILYPKLYQPRNIAIMIACIWLGPLVAFAPITFSWWGRFGLDPLVGTCTVIPDRNGNTPNILIITLGFVLPAFCIISCYSRILYLVRKSGLKSSSNIKEEATKSEHKSRHFSQEDSEIDSTITILKKNAQSTFKKRQRPKRLAQCPTKRDQRLKSMILALIISFFLYHIPIIIVKTVDCKFTNSAYGNITGYLFTYVMGCVHPLIYVVMSKEYRQAYKHLLKCVR